MSVQSKIQRLRELRGQAKLSQAAIAKALDLSQGYLSMLETGTHQNEVLLDRVIDFLEGEVKRTVQVRQKGERPFSDIVTREAGCFTWGWSQFPRGRAISDLCDEAKIDKKTFCLLVADVVGAGSKGKIEAAQLRFGFHSIASIVSPSNAHPSSFMGALARALKRTKRRNSGPPSVAVLSIESEIANIFGAFYGLPQPIVFRKKDGRPEKIPMPSADLLLEFQGRASEYVNFRLEVGDSILIYTDGFYEWLRRTQSQNGFKVFDLFEEAAKSFQGNASRIIRAIVEARLDKDISEPGDDATILVISRKN